MSKITLDEQVASVTFAADLLDRILPTYVQRGELEAGVALNHVKALRAIETTLRWIKANETIVRAAPQLAARIQGDLRAIRDDPAVEAVFKTFPEAFGIVDMRPIGKPTAKPTEPPRPENEEPDDED